MNDALNGSGKALQVRERIAELQDTRQRPWVHLPGFHILSPGGATPPYLWAVPKPKGDEQDLLGMWEMFVSTTQDNADGQADLLAPLRQDRQVLSAPARAGFFGREPRRFQDWFIPAAQIIAIAQHFEGQGALTVRTKRAPRFERTLFEEIEMHLGPYYMRVTPRGMWSNTDHRLRRPAAGAPTTRAIDAVCVRPMASSHPLAVALTEDEEMPEAALQAGNVVLRSMQNGLLPNRLHINVTARGAAPRAPREMFQQALAAASHSDGLRALASVLVPHRLTNSAFREIFGNHYRHAGPVRDSTRRRWVEEIHGLFPLEAA